MLLLDTGWGVRRKKVTSFRTRVHYRTSLCDAELQELGLLPASDEKINDVRQIRLRIYDCKPEGVHAKRMKIRAGVWTCIVADTGKRIRDHIADFARPGTPANIDDTRWVGASDLDKLVFAHKRLVRHLNKRNKTGVDGDIKVFDNSVVKWPVCSTVWFTVNTK